ncbi:hypothetical protein GCM10010399_90490 [Dactylosporangium fulvum]|uniref:Uncharacterized protein n=1 Tax=Dactylosporangium fulvum TaxID=53359 RepID=A0ABY5W7S2_9ACTN|nr:hypothetical protein [Dactylosporangium fulvum]UWP85064.1 hypothetical protein Dfulv_12880 [Dactylosporangium fulvum]
MANAKRDRAGTFFFRIFGPATVEGALHGCSPEARQQWKQFRERIKAAEAERRDEREPGAA